MTVAPASAAVLIARLPRSPGGAGSVKTVFLLVYDENDGLFDHVPPPVSPPGIADE